MHDRATNAITDALSFDIEDWFHMVEIEAVSNPDDWPRLSSLVERYTDLILTTCADAGVRATFFMLGWVARRHPQLARRIAGAGHEIGTHSFWHRRVDRLTPHEFRDDMRESIDVLQSQTGQKVRGFRAPSFSIMPGSEWAMDVLSDLGLEYDASLFPAPRGHGGYPCAPGPHLFTNTPSGQPIPELPMSILRLGPLKLPFSGGGYFRLLPLEVIEQGFEYMHRRGWPAVVYLHPRDFAPDCPIVPMPYYRRIKCYIGMRSTVGKLRAVLGRYRFNTCAAVLGLEDRPVKTAAGVASMKLTA